MFVFLNISSFMFLILDIQVFNLTASNCLDNLGLPPPEAKRCKEDLKHVDFFLFFFPFISLKVYKAMIDCMA